MYEPMFDDTYDEANFFFSRCNFTYNFGYIFGRYSPSYRFDGKVCDKVFPPGPGVSGEATFPDIRG